MKQQASLTVIVVVPPSQISITNAKELCEHLTATFSNPVPSAFPSRSSSASLNKRIFYYVPAEGDGAIQCNRKGCKFTPLKGIWKLHSVITSAQQLKILVRERSCYCSECFYENYDNCAYKDHVDSVAKVNLERERGICCCHTLPT